MFSKLLYLILSVSLLPIPQAQAVEAVLSLPVAGTMVNLSTAYHPAILKGLTVHKDNPFLLKTNLEIYE